MENKIKQWILYVYYFGMLIIYPLIMHDKYFDLTNTKLMTYYVVTSFLVLAVFLYIFLFGVKDCEFKIEFVLLIIIAIDIVLSFVINGHTADMLTGSIEYGSGVIFLLTLVLSCAAMLFLSNVDTGLIFAFITTISSILVGTFTLLQFCGIDIFKLISAIQENQRFVFLGPLGNVANLGCFTVIVLPICFYSLTVKSLRVLQILGGIGVFLSTITCLASNTDGSILALFVVLLLLGYIMTRQHTYSKYYYLAMLIVTLALAVAGIIARFNSAARSLDVHQKMLVNPIFLIPLFCIIVLGLIINLLAPAHVITAINNVACNLCLVGLICICLLPIAIIVYTNSHQSQTGSFLGSFLYFDNKWGTDRGFLWKSGLKIFSSGSFLQILFGRGAGGFYSAYMSNYYDLSVELGLYSNYDAHNVFLQFLCEYGLVGLLSAISFFVLRIKANLQSDNTVNMFKAISLIGAMVASFFFVFQNVTLGWIGVLI